MAVESLLYSSFDGYQLIKAWTSEGRQDLFSYYWRDSRRKRRIYTSNQIYGDHEMLCVVFFVKNMKWRCYEISRKWNLTVMHRKTKRCHSFHYSLTFIVRLDFRMIVILRLSHSWRTLGFVSTLFVLFYGRWFCRFLLTLKLLCDLQPTCRRKWLR